MSLALVAAGITPLEPPFKSGDQVVWNERLIKPDKLAKYIKIHGSGPFTVVQCRTGPDNFWGTLHIKNKRNRNVYWIRPKDLKPHLPKSAGLHWNLHDFKKA